MIKSAQTSILSSIFCTPLGCPGRMMVEEVRARHAVSRGTNFTLSQGNHIIDESEDYIVVHKPMGMYTEGSVLRGDENVCMFSAVKRYLTKGADNVRVVHRLDRDTSGVLVFSKSVEFSRRISWEFQERRVSKQYLCQSRTGSTPSEIMQELCSEQGLSLACGHGRAFRGSFGLYSLEDVGESLPSRRPSKVKYTKTRFTLGKAVEKEKAIVEAFPSTGKTHQIRLHLAYLQLPIVGDIRYGGEADLFEPGHYLHAHSLRVCDQTWSCLPSWYTPTNR